MHAWSDAGSHANAISARSPRHPSACGTRRPKSIIHDRPSERLAAGRSVASRRARLRTRWTLRPTADGAGCSARVRSSSLTPAGWTRGRQSRLNKKAHRSRTQRTARRDDVDGSSRASRDVRPTAPRCRAVTPVAPMSARRLSSSPPAASVRLAGSALHRRDHHGDRSRAREVRRHRRRPGRHHRRCVVAPRPDRSSRSIVIVFLARTVLASTSPPARVASAPSPTDARSPPPLSFPSRRPSGRDARRRRGRRG